MADLRRVEHISKYFCHENYNDGSNDFWHKMAQNMGLSDFSGINFILAVPNFV